MALDPEVARLTVELGRARRERDRYAAGVLRSAMQGVPPRDLPDRIQSRAAELERSVADAGGVVDARPAQDDPVPALRALAGAVELVSVEALRSALSVIDDLRELLRRDDTVLCQLAADLGSAHGIAMRQAFLAESYRQRMEDMWTACRSLDLDALRDLDADALPEGVAPRDGHRV